MPFIPNVLSQRDPLWKDEALGFDNSISIGTDGCALACLTMLVNGYGFNQTPSTMNKKFKDMGSGNGFLGGLIVWGGLTRAFPKIVFQNIIICRDQPAPITDINASLDSGQPLLVEVDRSPSTGLQTHWVVLAARQGEDYLMLDPWPQPADGGPVSLAGRFAFGRPLSQVITAVVWYDAGGHVPAPTPPAPIPNTPPPGPGVLVRVQAAMTAGLRLRMAPKTDSTTLAIEAAGTFLRCLEADAAVLAKIGITNQWLTVLDPGGLTGYIAAWYVDKAGQAAPAPLPAPGPAPVPPPPTSTPAPGGLTVVVSEIVGAAGLRMRAAADANAGTVLIVPAGTELAVIEAEAQARPKIGQQNQWLNVREAGGKTGFVAAWYVGLKPAAGTSSPKPGTPAPTDDAPPTSTNPPTSGLTVIVSSQATAGLRLRDQPNGNANTLKILTGDTVLTVLETASAAQAKIGVNGMWLKVQEPGGMSGYVAAWYVK